MRSTVNLFAYKHARWVPEDQNVPMPSPAEFLDGYAGAYFDCYSYQHMLNQVVNPAFARCITDEYDAQAIFSDQCLNRQLRSVQQANCKAFQAWSPNGVYMQSTLLSTVSVIYKGFAYLAQFPSGGNFPMQEPGTGTAWINCGESIRNSWNADVQYKIGDIVTYCLNYPSGNNFAFYKVAQYEVVPGVPPPESPDWDLLEVANRSVNPVATGGTITTVNGMRYHTFTSSGTFTFTASTGVDGGVFQMLAVGGGGGGGAVGGGGGGGNVIIAVSSAYAAGLQNTFSVTIGQGGTGGTYNVVGGAATIAATNGGATNVTLTSVTPALSIVNALGGGGGASTGLINGREGGSGGGGAQPPNEVFGDLTIGTVNPAYTTQQNAAQNGGEGGTQVGYGCGGGGGAFDAGFPASGPPTFQAGAGGAGRTFFSGVEPIPHYGGGGGGAAVANAAVTGPILGGIGGEGGGGDGAPYIEGQVPNPPSMTGLPNTGGGGGGASLGLVGEAQVGDVPDPVGGNGGSGIVIFAYNYTDGFNLRSNDAVVGTLPPTVSFNSSTSLFTLNLDSYGFGGTQLSNADDGYNGRNDDPGYPSFPERQVLNSSYNDHARDSWGLTGTMPNIVAQPYTIARNANRCYDERMVVEADDYFHSLFGNWPALRLQYVDPRTGLQTSYVRYVPQASLAGLNVPTPLPLFVPTVVTSGFLPYGRVAGNQVYLYTFPQDYPSIGNMWNPVDAIVVTTGVVPIEDDFVMAPTILGDTVYSATSGQVTSNQTQKILAEFVVKHPGSLGQEYRSEIIYDPQVRTMVDMQSATDFKQFDYQFNMRLKQSQILRRLGLPNGGSANMRVIFERKRPREV
jgi:hypothetical protein